MVQLHQIWQKEKSSSRFFMNKVLGIYVLSSSIVKKNRIADK